MVQFNIKSVALKWYFFTTVSFGIYQEFFHVFMKQLGLSAQQIGLTNLFGVLQLCNPLIMYAAGKYRARKMVIWIMSLMCMISCVLPLLPLVVSLPTCFETRSNDYSSTNSSTSVDIHPTVPWMSNMFLVMTVSRSTLLLIEAVALSLASKATITYLGRDRVMYGSYLMWVHVGTSTLVPLSAFCAWKLRINICGIKGYGYFASFLIAALVMLLSLLSVPFFEFKYESNREISYWKAVKGVALKGHYIYMYLLTFYFGVCVSFQIFWEFWYLDGLGASPLVMGMAAMVRRPFLAVSLYLSTSVMKKIGDLYSVSLSFLLFTIAFCALSFTRVYWYVLTIDTLNSGAYGFAYSAFTVHFSKAGSEAISGFMIGMQGMCFYVGLDVGASVFGLLFHSVGTLTTLLIFAASCGVMLILLLLYLKFSEHVEEYERIPDDDHHHDEDKDNDFIDED